MSTDLAQIDPAQQRVIVKEIQRYRQLNLLKQDYLYDVQSPQSGDDTAAVTYYSDDNKKAGVLLYRYDREGAFSPKVRFRNLQASTTYQVRDVDLGSKIKMTGKNLMQKGVSVSFNSERLSAMLFLDPAP